MVPESHPRYYATLVVMSLNTSLICNNFSVFSCFMNLTLLRILARSCVGCPYIGAFVWCFSHAYTGVLSFWVEDHSKVSFSSHHNEYMYYQHDLSLFMLTLKTWLRQSLPGFSIVRLPFFSLSHTVVLRRKPLCEIHT